MALYCDSKGDTMKSQFRQVFFNYQGRIPRRVFWPYGVVLSLLYMLSWVIALWVGFAFGVMRLEVIGTVLLFAPYLMLVPMWRVALKRCHDRGHSGSYIFLVSMLPGIGLPWLIFEMAFLRGTPGPNRFGPEPG